MLHLSAKTALVTGASKGIGRGIALELARRGCDVAVNYSSDEKGARQTAADIEKLGRRAIIVRANVGLSSEVDAMLEKVLGEFERLWILINNAGVQVFKPLLDLEEPDWDRVIDTNLKGNFLFTKVAAAELGPHGITVNCVAPGAIEIERTKAEAPDYAGTWGPLAPMKRVGQPRDVAAAVCFLAADEAEFITGQTLYVDGGLFTKGPWPYET
jgi:NAD(P)-dependent dehydrogenase (short-subunit alcohol dehydrogenase family)